MRSPDERVAWAKSQAGTTSWTGQCEAFTRSCFPFDAAYGSANDAYHASASAGPVHLEYEAPVGVPVFWDITYGTNAAYDHVALSAGDGWCYSTSAGPGSTLALVGIAELTTRWGMTYRGWAEIYHGTRVWEEDGDMALSDEDVARIATAVWQRELIEGDPVPAESASRRLLHIRQAVVSDQQRDGTSSAHVNAGSGCDDVSLSTAQGWTLDSLRVLKEAVDDARELVEAVAAALDVSPPPRGGPPAPPWPL